MQIYHIKNIKVVNEGKIETKDIFIKNNYIEKIGNSFQVKENAIEIDGEGSYLLPGLIDDQVHFREPGLTHKADIFSESRAAVAGGVTSFMEMPNTAPPVFTQELLEDKYNIAAKNSIANYSFYMGTANDNLEEVLKTNEKKNEVCGVKIFMGSSTGNLLVDNEKVLKDIFSKSELLIATHCEDEKTIADNLAKYKAENSVLTASHHPLIRNEEACFKSSSLAVQLAKETNARLHILHITTADELKLFSKEKKLKDKKITSEVCVHHLHFTADDYARLGNQIKCNPAIKAAFNRDALWQALLNDTLDVIATDHAPHLWEEKLNHYLQASSGLPLVQHSLLLLLHYYKQGKISLEKIVEKTSHSVAECFKIKNRGYIREGYFADLVIVNFNKKTKVTKENILYKCQWSPLEGDEFPAEITHTFVNGNLVYEKNKIIASNNGMRLEFER